MLYCGLFILVVVLYSVNKPQFIHSTVDGHSGSSQCLAIMNHAAMNVLVHGFGEIYVYIYVGCIPRSGISGSICTSLGLSICRQFFC